MEWQQFERERAASTESSGDLAVASSANFNSSAAIVTNNPAAAHNSSIPLQSDIQKRYYICFINWLLGIGLTQAFVKQKSSLS